MQFNLDQDDTIVLVRGYEPGCIFLRDETLRHSAIVTSTQARPWDATVVADLSENHFAAVLELRPEIVLLGSGLKLEFPSQAVMATVLSQGIGFEIMDTAAACRTYNILAMEGRNVAAALLV
ncbi:MAG: MTH938/NDUFAF3 family protein [Pseudomonadota bacterium]